jgi:thiol:disulfide interchange protein DsbC
MNALRIGVAAAAMALTLATGAGAQNNAPTLANAAAMVPPAVDSALRKNLAERVPSLGKVDEISRAPVAGLFEIRVGTDIFYSDAEGNFLINGQIIDTRTRRNITEERTEKLLAINFDQLPLKDAFTVVRGNGKRKLAVFEDPNCGYCKSFERELQKIDNVTVYMFLFPILGPNSVERSRAHWCAKDKAKSWQDWMVRGEAPQRAENCDVMALARNVEFGKKHKITGTPTLIFADGSRVPGAIGAADIEKLLVANK